MTKQIAVVIGHPFAKSFNHVLADRYANYARGEGAEVRVIDLATQEFRERPSKQDDLRVLNEADVADYGPEITEMVETLQWADHIAFFHPVWWGTYPAALKAFIDRTFLDGIAFIYAKKYADQIKRFQGKTARIFYTMNAPSIWYWFKFGRAGLRSLRDAVLGYCGVKTLGAHAFTRVRYSTPDTREYWLSLAAKWGKKDGRS